MPNTVNFMSIAWLKPSCLVRHLVSGIELVLVMVMALFQDERKQNIIEPRRADYITNTTPSS